MKTFCLGDVHGAYKALLQVLRRADFDLESDKLIVLGDVADGWSEVMECFEYLMTNVKNLVYIKGNHDEWLLNFLETAEMTKMWVMQGGKATLKSYMKSVTEDPTLASRLMKFLQKVDTVYIDEKNRCFVHGGVYVTKMIGDEDFEFTAQDRMWDRGLWEKRSTLDSLVEESVYSEIYVGHTSIWEYSRKPITYGNVTFMDTGGGDIGVLSLMDIESKRIFQSDKVSDLYPNDYHFRFVRGE